MRLRFERRPGDEARAFWIVALCVLGVGLYLVQERYEHAIALSRTQSELFYSRIVANDRIVQQARQLHRLERAVRADLAGLSGDSTPAGTTVRFIANLQQCATKNGVRISMLQPDGAQESQPTVAASELHAEPVTITAVGRFPALVRFIAQLSHQRTLLEIGGTQFALREYGANRPSEPAVEATIQAVLYRLAPRGEEEASVAPVR